MARSFAGETAAPAQQHGLAEGAPVGELGKVQLYAVHAVERQVGDVGVVASCKTFWLLARVEYCSLHQLLVNLQSGFLHIAGVAGVLCRPSISCGRLGMRARVGGRLEWLVADARAGFR